MFQDSSHVGALKQSSTSWLLFLSKRILLFQSICRDAVHVSENPLYVTTRSWGNFWNCPDLNKKFLKADYQSKHCTDTEALQRPWRLNLMKIFHINLLTYEAMFTGWNPTRTEASLSIKSRLWCSKGTIDRKALYFLHFGTYRLQVTADDSWFQIYHNTAGRHCRSLT